MGEEQRLPPAEQLAAARAAFESGTDFTVAVEEEFALLDPHTLTLVNRFEDVQSAAKGTELEPHLVGELIASEAEVRTGKCADFAEAAATMAVRRGQLQALARELGLQLGATGTHPWARWQDQRIIDTPHYRRNDELLRYVVWRNNTFGLHVHVGIRGADRAVGVCNALRNLLPELLALSASSPFVEDVNTGLHSARTEVFTRMFPRCGIPDAYDRWRGFDEYVAFLYRTGSITEHTQSGGAAAHLAYPTVEIRICDGSSTAEAQARSAVVRARRALRQGARRGRAAPRPAEPPARGEPLACDPLRAAGRAGSTSRARRRCRRARGSSSSWSGCCRSRRRSAPPSWPSRPRTRPSGSSRWAEGASLRRSTRSRSARRNYWLRADSRRLTGSPSKVRQLDVGTFALFAATLTSLAYAKLDAGRLDDMARRRCAAGSCRSSRERRGGRRSRFARAREPPARVRERWPWRQPSRGVTRTPARREPRRSTLRERDEHMSWFMDHAVLLALVCAAVTAAYGLWLVLRAVQPEGNERMREIRARCARARRPTCAAVHHDRDGRDRPVHPHRRLQQASLAPRSGAPWAPRLGGAGFIGMNVSVRTAHRRGARSGLEPALNVAFRAGSVTGLLVVGLALGGVAGYYWLLTAGFDDTPTQAIHARRPRSAAR
jgi:carboxylate-amine ligase